MSKLIMWNLMTLDGYFEGEKAWDLNWHHSIFDAELEQYSIDQLNTTDALVFGRATYEGMAAYWKTATGEVADAMNALPKIVFSRTLERADWNNTSLAKGELAAEIEKVKRIGTRNAFVFGSGKLCLDLMKHELFDEYRIAIAPMVTGKGRLLFPAGAHPTKLKLAYSRVLKNGGIILWYEPKLNNS
jgi:dihydrofolate reductase